MTKPAKQTERQLLHNEIEDIFDPKTMRIVSEVAGVPLTIIMPTEIGHTNIQTAGGTVDDLMRELDVEPRANCVCVDEQNGYDPLRESARITTITSYCAAIPGLYDDSYISNVRPYCNLPELYTEWSNYRLEEMKQEIENIQATIIQHVSRDRDSFPLDEVYHFAEQQISYLKRTARQMVDQTLCAEVRRHFGVREINATSEKWVIVRAHQRFKDLLPGVMAQTLVWRPVCLYLSDWEETKYMIRSGNVSFVYSQQGTFSWDQYRFEEYLFGDELLRQGLKEVLLAWLHRFDLLNLEKDS
ncbi:unnamed protein product [Aspergillus oryzae var. brunneus]|uniref:Unnamed protein product n=1 Tax=Aspergillus oryzae var. brunneus TaxID=332754 RepID=A0ABQ6L6P2_ASPOZ|nr:unnamed protein product [Aspergillus oryzae var. brunneus]